MAVIIHGHFYQPPRENPWTGRIDVQPDAAPFHDWNERIYAECYRPNAFATVTTSRGERIVNNFERISFNVGPTLMQWIQRHHPETHARIIEADQRSIDALGDGNAMAQAFHHTILPLSDARDVRTEIRWGLADFRYRFKREPAGMWLPEAAADDAVLGTLIDEGIRFTVLAPQQAGAWRDPNADWVDAAHAPINTRRPYRYHHADGSGRWINLFFYDGQIARAIAFENAGSSAEGFLDLFGYENEDDLAHAATDGETYGHHHTFSELGLAYALFVEADKRGITVTNYEAYLQEHPAEAEARVAPGGTSWSCAHGVERWRSDCGCTTRSETGWNQRWRGPLREALEVLKRRADDVYETEMGSVASDPWAARDAYVDVVIGARDLGGFLDEHTDLHADTDRERATAALSLQHAALSMFTSCGWFFSDLADIETVQVLRYAARTVEILEGFGDTSARGAFMGALAHARSNRVHLGTGADVFASMLAAGRLR